MHFHLPKPLHGWREFAGEVGIIVVGVLIALTAEQAVEAWHWHRQVEKANESFKIELEDAAASAYERLAIQSCLTNRLSEVARRLDAAGLAWRGMPEHFGGAQVYYSNVLPVVYRPPAHNVPIQGWANALANGTLNHLSTDRAEVLGAAYSFDEQFQTDQRQESVAIAKLSPLALDRTLSPDERLQMLQVVSELDRMNDLLVTDSRNFLEALRDAHLGYDDAEVQRGAGNVLKLQRGYRGTCVKALPIHLN